jgi:ArsR family transcriptional regulator
MSIYTFDMATTQELSPTSVLAQQLKALGDETRLNLLLKIAGANCVDGACICDLTPDTNLAQSTVSHHMKLLVDAGLLTRSQKGKWAYFTLTADGRNLLMALNLKPLHNSDTCCSN